MSIPKKSYTQRSFSGGQVNAAAKRRDDADTVKNAARLMVNWRIEAAESTINRPGRTKLYQTNGGRGEYVRMGVNEYILDFGVEAGTGHGKIVIHNKATGATVASAASASYLWTANTLPQIVWCQAVNDVVICYPGMQPQIARWSRAANTWSFLAYDFRVVAGQKMEPFLPAVSAPGATMSYPGVSGSQPLTCSAAYFTPGMVGRSLSIGGQQCTITAYTDPQHVQINIAYLLPASVSVLVDNCAPFIPGQIVQLKVQGVVFEVSSVQVGAGQSAPGGTVTGTLVSSILFPNVPAATSGEQLLSPIGFATCSFGPTNSGIPLTARWQEEFMSATAGWPASCFFDRDRLGFTDFPQRPEAILWCAVGAPDFVWIDSLAAATQPAAGALPNSAILEFVPGSPRVRFVVGGFLGDQFVFTDKAIYQIPIQATGNPLKPGSVAFSQFSNDGVAPIQPITTQDCIIYINQGRQRVSAVRATGTYTRAYVTDDISDLHSDLFTGPIALALTTGDGLKPERYAYVLNADGSQVIGKFTHDRTFVGWVPWISAAAPEWLTAIGSAVFYTVPHGANHFIEAEDFTVFLDSAQLINPGGSYFVPNTTIRLMDGLLDKGNYQVDGAGNVVPGQPGEDLSSPTLIGGYPFSLALVPFVPNEASGEAQGQRQRPRKVSQITVAVELSSGFAIGGREFPAYNFGDDQSLPPVLREGSFSARPLGISYDPQVPITKDTPGPLRICEITIEATV